MIITAHFLLFFAAMVHQLNSFSSLIAFFIINRKKILSFSCTVFTNHIPRYLSSLL